MSWKRKREFRKFHVQDIVMIVMEKVNKQFHIYLAKVMNVYFVGQEVSWGLITLGIVCSINCECLG